MGIARWQPLQWLGLNRIPVQLAAEQALALTSFMRTIDPQPHHESIFFEHIRRLLGELSAANRALLRQHLQWVELHGGEALMQQGDPGDAMYLSVSGRLRAYVNDAEGRPQPVRDMARGQLIGEISLVTDQARTASVVAVRDSVLARLAKGPFLALLEASPGLGVALMKLIAHRLQTQGQRNPLALPVCTALLPASDGVDLAAFAHDLAGHMARLGKTRVVTVADADAMLGGAGLAQRSGHEPELRSRIAAWLDEIEAEHEFILLVGDAQPSPWSRCCSRQCDEVLLLARAQAQPLVHAVEQDCLLDQATPRHAEAAQVLVLLHDEATRCPQHTARWLARRPVADHVHIRPTLARDMARLARLQTRSAVGLVLAGGGARGFAHLGVYRALQEAGVEIDCVGGTSMGAVMATLVASDRPLDDVLPVLREAFRINPTGDFNWLPMISLIRGQRLRRIVSNSLNALAGRLPDSEDLWKNFYCVASNYSQAREEVLARGPLMQNLLASIAIPGALPPVVRDGDLLCDGGTLNNFPADVMRGLRGVGTVIGVDLNTKKPRRLDFAETPGTWALLRDRLRPRAKRRYRLPTLSAYLMNVTILYSSSRQRASQRQTDLYFNPPLERVGLLQWNRIDHIVAQGYAHAKEVLASAGAQWRLRGGGEDGVPDGSAASASPGGKGETTL